jgi:hypothetical protein
VSVFYLDRNQDIHFPFKPGFMSVKIQTISAAESLGPERGLSATVVTSAKCEDTI